MPWGFQGAIPSITSNLASGGTLFTVDPGNGLETAIAAVSFVGFPSLDFPRVNAMDFHPDSDIPYVSVNDGEGGLAPIIWRPSILARERLPMWVSP